ncbi:MAG: hypothetical protein QW412_03300, partial [Candidatus Aenigmatarchaeota archaeon]
GIGIAPASGSYNFSLDGGIINFTVYNNGDSDIVYTLKLSGNASNFTTVEPSELEIKANSYGKFRVTVNPTLETKEGESYTLIATAKALTSRNIGVAAESRIIIYFGSPRTKPYFETYLFYLIVSVGIVITVSTTFIAYRKLKKVKV